ncbi:MAG: translational GTPase TypA [Proteobacteria bacterium]|nr:translational GTPase TypA [Pseudomonadota bacterium]
MDYRNIAIIAHVDHGKTTLVDSMFRQSGTFRNNQRVDERAMDSNDLERERGITILAKCTSVEWKGTRINIVDTPGHADFGGEVERILGMVDGVVLLVDAAEGPMPQTKFVTAKALALGLRPIVVINKIDRSDARAEEVHEEIFDLFDALGADEKQLDFPVLYASGRNGWASRELGQQGSDLSALFETVHQHVPAPTADPSGPFRLLVSIQEADPFLGRIVTGRIFSGIAKPNMTVRAMTRDGEVLESGRISKILAFRGLLRVPVEMAEAGDIVAIAGLQQVGVADTLAAPEVTEPLPTIPVDPPTLAMNITINDSPLAGREGKKVTSREIRARLFAEAEGNVAIRVTETEDKDTFEVAGRGELQLGVLIETMRREGFELCIGRPRVLNRADPVSGQMLEPMEDVQVDVDEAYAGIVVEAMAMRKGELLEMKPSGGGKIRLAFVVPSRGLIGYLGTFLTTTRGTGVMSRIFKGYGHYKGHIAGRRAGVLISNADGQSVSYALASLEERGALFIGGGEKVYAGMLIGEHSRGNDLEVNPLKSKQLTNIRTVLKDDAIRLTPPKRMSLEEAITYIEDNELVEVTPKSIRLRKRQLDPHERKREQRRRADG